MHCISRVGGDCVLPPMIRGKSKDKRLLSIYGMSKADLHAAYASLMWALCAGATAALITAAATALPLFVNEVIRLMIRLSAIKKGIYIQDVHTNYLRVFRGIIPDIPPIIIYGWFMALIRRWSALNQKYLLLDMGHGQLRVGPEDAAGTCLGGILVWVFLAIHDLELLGWWLASVWWAPGLLITSIWLSVYDRLIVFGRIPPEALLNTSINQQLTNDCDLAEIIKIHNISLDLPNRAMTVVITKLEKISRDTLLMFIRKVRTNSDVKKYIDVIVVITTDTTYRFNV